MGRVRVLDQPNPHACAGSHVNWTFLTSSVHRLLNCKWW